MIGVIHLIAASTNIIAPINKIIPFSNVDGPGNRMAIFFQSCPFKCFYCHNPETINMCNHCGLCVEPCPVKALSIKDNKVIWDETICIGCDTCIKVCPYLSSPKIKYMDIASLLEQIKKAKPFIQGITVSGGEATNHIAFLTALFKEVKALDLTTFIDTNGAHDFKKHQNLLNVTDKMMLDIKAHDNAYHQYLTKSDNTIVLANLDYLLSIDKLYEVRTVLLHDAQRNIDTVSKIASKIKNKCYYKLIKYRPFGVRAEGLAECGTTSVNDSQLIEMVALAHKYGATKTIAI
ncbi:MAG: YjjW family glycine radical enzyme activase [Erysipelotrichaceae bacterium]|nr:YjjW family glycine radical enzyme activase [Erysipelotrichaceae bacterium]